MDGDDIGGSGGRKESSRTVTAPRNDFKKMLTLEEQEEIKKRIEIMNGLVASVNEKEEQKRRDTAKMNKKTQK